MISINLTNIIIKHNYFKKMKILYKIYFQNLQYVSFYFFLKNINRRKSNYEKN